jgi:hypothetical protein
VLLVPALVPVLALVLELVLVLVLVLAPVLALVLVLMWMQEQVLQVQLWACWTAPRCSPRRGRQAAALPRAVLLRAARRRARRAGCGGGYSMTG